MAPARCRRGDVLDRRRAHGRQREQDPGGGGRGGARDLALGLHHPGEAGGAMPNGSATRSRGPRARCRPWRRRAGSTDGTPRRRTPGGPGPATPRRRRRRRCSRTQPSAYAALRDAPEVLDRQRRRQPPLLRGQGRPLELSRAPGRAALGSCRFTRMLLGGWARGRRRMRAGDQGPPASSPRTRFPGSRRHGSSGARASARSPPPGRPRDSRADGRPADGAAAGPAVRDGPSQLQLAAIRWPRSSSRSTRRTVASALACSPAAPGRSPRCRAPPARLAPRADPPSPRAGHRSPPSGPAREAPPPAGRARRRRPRPRQVAEGLRQAQEHVPAPSSASQSGRPSVTSASVRYIDRTERPCARGPPDRAAAPEPGPASRPHGR